MPCCGRRPWGWNCPGNEGRSHAMHVDVGTLLFFCRHAEYCNADRTTWKLTLQYINTTPKELKTERDCSRRQLFCPLWGSSVWRNQRSGSDEKISAHSDFSPRGAGGTPIHYMCRPTGSWFWSSWFRKGYPFQRRFLERGIKNSGSRLYLLLSLFQAFR